MLVEIIYDALKYVVAFMWHRSTMIVDFSLVVGLELLIMIVLDPVLHQALMPIGVAVAPGVSWLSVVT